MLGKPIAAHKIISEYEQSGLILYGTLGVDAVAIISFFTSRGYKVTVTRNTANYDANAKKNTANIVFYFHNSSAHYVAIRWDGNSFIGYNTFNSSDGEDDWRYSISGFLEDYSYSRSLLISIS